MKKDMFEKAKAYMESEEGKKSIKEYFNKLELKDKILEGRLLRVNGYLENNSLDKLMDRLKKDNGDEWSDKCYKRGYQPYPTNLFSLMISYANGYGKEPTEEEDMDPNEYGFLSSEYILENYKFQTFCGQGCFDRVLKKINGKWEQYFQN